MQNMIMNIKLRKGMKIDLQNECIYEELNNMARQNDDANLNHSQLISPS